MDIAGSRILVTGATGGLGVAIVGALAAGGAHVVVSGRRTVALEALAARVGGDAVVADLGDAAAVEELVGVAAACDAVVCNAGLLAGTVDEVLDVNLRAPMRLAEAFVAARRASGGPGAVVFTGSVAGVTSSPGMGAYNASKAGLRGFALSLAQDLAGTSVTSTHLVVGYVADAGMLVDSGDRAPAWVRTRTPGDVADAVVSAIRTGPVERWVAPLELRLAVTAAGVFPRLAGRIRRRTPPLRT